MPSDEDTNFQQEPSSYIHSVASLRSRCFRWTHVRSAKTLRLGANYMFSGLPMNYINNLHPRKHKKLYGNHVLSPAISIWDITPTFAKAHVPYEIRGITQPEPGGHVELRSTNHLVLLLLMPTFIYKMNIYVPHIVMVSTLSAHPRTQTPDPTHSRTLSPAVPSHAQATHSNTGPQASPPSQARTAHSGFGAGLSSTPSPAI